MSPSLVLTVVGAVVALAWLPIFLRFYWNWRQRRNPISLAICGAIGFFMYIDGAVTLFLSAGALWAISILVVLNALGCLNFYFMFWWARRRFPDSRS